MFFIGKTKRGDTGRVIGRSRKIRMISTGAFSLLAILTLFAVFPIVRHKDEAEATTVPATTTLSIISSKDTASVDITPTSGTGTFATSAATDQAEFSVTTDNLTGYSVTLLGSDTSGQLVNAVTGDTLDTITADTTENDFRTGAASTYANKWGYRLNVNGTTTTNFMAAPTTSTAKTIYSTNAPNVTTDNYTLALGARIDYEKPAGTYTNTFVLTAVGNPITYKITYWDDTDKLGEDGQSNITASKFTISQADPTKSGAVFKGWCYGTIDHTTNPSSCGGTPGDVYQSGDTFTFTSLPSSGTATAELYAMWEDAGNIMQNLDPKYCTTTPRTVIDIRDNQEYTVQRLADGNCWLLDNLRLGAATIQQSLSTANTNMDPSTPFTFPSASTTTGFNSTTTAMYNSDYSDTTTTYWGIGSGKTGVYYNFCAATAGTYCTSSGSTNASYDICPAGWRMPTGGSNGEYQNLYVAYSSNHTNFKTALSLPTAGFYLNDSQSSFNSYGNFWSSTLRDSNTMYYMYVAQSNAWPTGNANGNYYYGYSMRCVLKETMQNFTSNDGDKMTTGNTRELVDERDGQIYRVTKLGNGSVWMTRNLAIGCNGNATNYGNGHSQKTLTSADSNVSSSYSTPTTAMSAGDSYVNPYQTCDSTYGAYYNYAAVSAGTITGASNTDETEYSVCPKGWRLPTGAEANAVTSYRSQFNVVTGGGYSAGSRNWTQYGYWWTSTAYNTTIRHTIYGNSSTLNYYNQDPRVYGMYIRCIKADDYPSMQSLSTEDLDVMIPNVGDYITLKDNRDGEKYIVSRLADGNVWTLDNLRLDLTTVSLENLKGNTNASDEALTYLKNGGGSAPYTAYAVRTGNNQTRLYPEIYTGYKDTVRTHDGIGTGKGGIHYNQCAASAGTICRNSVTESENLHQDICPSGWKMPTGNTEPGSYYYLYNNAYAGDANSFKQALSMSYVGYYNGTLKGGTSAYYLTSTLSSATDSYILGATSGSTTINPQSGTDRLDGMSVRCIKDDTRTISSISTMQGITPYIAANTADGDTKTLRDTRDNKDYTVTKINGTLWMTKNLAIGCTGATRTAMQVTSADSNVATTWPTTPSVVAALSTDDYTTPRMECSSNPDYGAWYNYSAATANTITGNSNAGAQTYDICPKGWRMPNRTEADSVLTSFSDFNPVLGGDWSGGTNNNITVSAYWWLSTNGYNTATTTNRDILRNNSNPGIASRNRYWGHYIRCVAR